MWRDLWKRPLSDPKPKMGFLHNRDLRILNYVNPKFQWDSMIATLVNRHASKYCYKCHSSSGRCVERQTCDASRQWRTTLEPAWLSRGRPITISHTDIYECLYLQNSYILLILKQIIFLLTPCMRLYLIKEIKGAVCKWHLFVCLNKVWYICNSMKCKIDYMQLIVYIIESYKYIICKNNSKE